MENMKNGPALDINLSDVVFNFGNNAKDSGYNEPVAILAPRKEGTRDKLIFNQHAMTLMGFDKEKNQISFLPLSGEIFCFNTTEVERPDKLNISKNGSVTSKKVCEGLTSHFKLDRTVENVFSVTGVTHSEVKAAQLSLYVAESDRPEDADRGQNESLNGPQAEQEDASAYHGEAVPTAAN